MSDAAGGSLADQRFGPTLGNDALTPTPYRDPPPAPIIARRSYRNRATFLAAVLSLAIAGFVLAGNLGPILLIPLVVTGVVVGIDLCWRSPAYGLLGIRVHAPWPDETPIAAATPYVVRIHITSFGGWLVRLVVFPSGLGIAFRPFFFGPPVRAFIARDDLRSVEKVSFGWTKVVHDGDEVPSAVGFYRREELREALQSLVRAKVRVGEAPGLAADEAELAVSREPDPSTKRSV